MSNPWKESFEDLRSSIERVYEEQQSQEANIIKKARQLAYDIRYEVKKSFGKDGNLNASAIKRAYLKKLSASPAPGPVKLKAKQMLVGVKEDFEFVEEEIKKKKDTYRVTDAETKHSYVRKADTKKAEELRRNPKIASVERTGSSDNYEGGKPKRWQDSDGDGKWYEPGEDVKAPKKKVKKESFSNWRDEMGENFFFKSLNEKVSPASPYCDVMPDSKTKSGKEGDAEKVRQNKMLTRKEDFNPLMEELGGELIDVSENIASLGKAGLSIFKTATKVKSPALKLGKDAPGAIVKYKPPGKLTAPKGKTSTTAIEKVKVKDITKPKQKTGEIVKAKPKTTAITKTKTKTGQIVKVEPKTKELAKLDPKDLAKTQVGTLVKTDGKTGAIVGTKTPIPPVAPGGTIPRGGRSFDIPIPGLPKLSDPARGIGFVKGTRINQ